ncbi:hypothetical protein [Actinokineospora diospyrosa]|uniref:Uncharacterized protein n=1 Tax=Actinokineospora diospyrosa TaxID=103728 RepID=A0ABT1ICA8_9PSEU|nr:hypothetical protein [Actinokineospora diospyrosa]MCP2270199.1 hypothetical protein [Actinokineospora diospyrosa]
MTESERVVVVDTHTMAAVLGLLVDQMPGLPVGLADGIRDDVAQREWELAFDFLTDWLMEEEVSLTPRYFRQVAAVGDYLAYERAWMAVTRLRCQVHWGTEPPEEEADLVVDSTTVERSVRHLVIVSCGLDREVLIGLHIRVESGDLRGAVEELFDWVEAYRMPVSEWFFRNAGRVVSYFGDDRLAERMSELRPQVT